MKKKQKSVLGNPYSKALKEKLRADIKEWQEKIINIQSIEWNEISYMWKQLEIEYYMVLIDNAKEGLKQLKGK
jgi:hypothetical protein